MSRKDYRELARILADYRTRMDEFTFSHFVADLCDWMQDENPRFDRSRFVDAVGTVTLG